MEILTTEKANSYNKKTFDKLSPNDFFHVDFYENEHSYRRTRINFFCVARVDSNPEKILVIKFDKDNITRMITGEKLLHSYYLYDNKEPINYG